MPGKTPIFPNLVRKINGSFSWIEHRFVHDGFLQALSSDELLLYYFLITVGDRNGVSYYDYEKICQLLKMEVEVYIRARNGLIERRLIACHQGVFQVLPLPERILLQPSYQPPARGGDFQTLAGIFKRLKEAP